MSIDNSGVSLCNQDALIDLETEEKQNDRDLNSAWTRCTPRHSSTSRETLRCKVFCASSFSACRATHRLFLPLISAFAKPSFVQLSLEALRTGGRNTPQTSKHFTTGQGPCRMTSWLSLLGLITFGSRRGAVARDFWPGFVTYQPERFLCGTQSASDRKF